MNCERVKELSADYLIGELPEELRAQVEAHLAGCAPCRDEIRDSQAIWAKLESLPVPEPSPAMDARFHAMLALERRRLGAEKQAASPQAKLARWLELFWPRRVAVQFGLAILLFSLGLLLGPSVAALRRPGSQSSGADNRALAQLREEIAGLKQTVTLALLQQASASERLRGVEWCHQLPAPDEQVLAALLRALDSDSNVNVRLAAVDALQQFAGRTAVKQALLASLPRQDSPLVQIELIRLLVGLEEREAVPVLKTLLQNSGLNPTVRQRAEWGLDQLS